MWVLLGSGASIRGYGMWQPLPAACLQMHLASFGRNRTQLAQLTVNFKNDDHRNVETCGSCLRLVGYTDSLSLSESISQTSTVSAGTAVSSVGRIWHFQKCSAQVAGKCLGECFQKQAHAIIMLDCTSLKPLTRLHAGDVTFFSTS